MDYLPLTGIGAVRRVNTATHKWDDSEPLATPRVHNIKLGAGMPKDVQTSVSVRDQGWWADLPDMRIRLLEDLSEEVLGAMSERSVVMEWTHGVFPLGHVQDGGNHFWWEIRAVEVGTERPSPPGALMYRLPWEASVVDEHDGSQDGTFVRFMDRCTLSYLIVVDAYGLREYGSWYS